MMDRSSLVRSESEFTPWGEVENPHPQHSKETTRTTDRMVFLLIVKDEGVPGKKLIRTHVIF